MERETRREPCRQCRQKKKVCPACDYPDRPKAYVQLRIRACLKCDRPSSRKLRYPFICTACKRHVDYLEHDEGAAA